jgi:hypothetical protein
MDNSPCVDALLRHRFLRGALCNMRSVCDKRAPGAVMRLRFSLLFSEQVSA